MLFNTSFAAFVDFLVKYQNTLSVYDKTTCTPASNYLTLYN